MAKCTHPHPVHRYSNGACRACHHAATKKYYAKTPERKEKRLQATREWRKKNRDTILAKRRKEQSKWNADNPVIAREKWRAQGTKWRAANPDRARLNKRRWLGISDAHRFHEVLAAQGGVCAIHGGADWSGRGKSPHADHDHNTGLLRGVLCHKCNTGLGLFQDSLALLLAAAEYLQAHAKAVPAIQVDAGDCAC